MIQDPSSPENMSSEESEDSEMGDENEGNINNLSGSWDAAGIAIPDELLSRIQCPLCNQMVTIVEENT